MSISEEKINEVFNLAIYLQFMGVLIPHSNFDKIKEIVSNVHEFLKTSTNEEIAAKLPQTEILLHQMTESFIKKFPPKKTINEIAFDWNELFKNGNDPFTYGITYGWLEKQMDASKLYDYNYLPTHFNIGLYAHAGFGAVEETFLLQDAFNTLVKTDYNYNLLEEYRKILKNLNKDIDKNTYIKISDLKFEVCSYSRLTIISFYSFIECFVNSIGFSYLERNRNMLLDKDIEILQGRKKNSYLSLKSKIEKFQKIIRKDKTIKIITSDDKQIKEPFTSFFDKYEEIRNSSVHYSPSKEAIWLKPEDWVKNANEFAKLSIQVGLEFWDACYDKLGKPDYLGKFEFDRLYKISKERLRSTKQIEWEIDKVTHNKSLERNI